MSLPHSTGTDNRVDRAEHPWGVDDDPAVPKVIASLARFMIDGLRSTGLDIDRFCSAVELDPQALDIDNSWVPRVKLYRLYSMATELTGDADIGLRATSQVGPGIFDVVGYVMMSSATLLAALQRLVHFVTLLDTSVAVSLVKEGDAHRLACRFLDRYTVPRQYGDAGITIMFGLCRILGGPALRVRGIGVMHTAPENVSVYEQTFHCPVAFGQNQYSILIADADLRRPLLSANKELAPLHEMVAEMHLSTRRYFSVPGEVRKMIMESLSEGVPRIETIAGRLCMSKRTLQRTLKQAGLPFNQLVNDVRQSQARLHLGNPRCSLQEVAYRVGFRELSSFYRACHQWFGMAPGHYRALLAAEGGEASTPTPDAEPAHG